MFVKKKRPGGSSHGYQWPKGGEWLDIPADHAHELVTISPDDFTAEPELPRGAKVYKPTAAAEDEGGEKTPEE
jgi:hypothetical protein